jgi:hypothetical protein
VLLTIAKGMITGGKTKELETLRIPVEGSFSDARVDVGAVLDIDVEQNKEALKTFLTSTENDTVLEEDIDTEPINKNDNINTERTESEDSSK